ncbi:MAG: hypothetical protein CMH04_03600 [Marinovum sp.]|nr:hypothetical protein [Marinovum sp.]|tara:strand:- start:405 stop:2120 length:1716 start_codon:yes stop_codon:yes gene_type:complete
MIKFKSVKWRNFLSTGNNETKIELDRSPSTLVVGQNGSGKSTMLDALSFGLFGKPHRSISKNQLVNSINKKHAMVEVEFDVGQHKFKIIRGINPGKFEIWQNGNMINQASNARDYQKFLEQNILKLNHKSFHQIVVLGSSSFIPFMQLNAGHRREVIEDLLDINIFSKMNNILKDKLGKLKEEIKDANYNLELTREKIDLQRKYIREITEINTGQVDAKRADIEQHESEIETLQAACKQASDYIDEHNSEAESLVNKLNNKRQTLLNYRHQFEQQVKTTVKDAKFYEDNAECPTCEQEIGEELRDRKIEEAKVKAVKLKEALDDVTTESDNVASSLESVNEILSNIRSKQQDIHTNNTTIDRLQKAIKTLHSDINNLTGSEGDLGQANAKLDELFNQRDSIGDNKLKLMEDKSYSDAAAEMLKDTGIKTKVIKQYLPVMNKLVNQYLQVLDFFVSFNLDENFNEVIRSRHRDAFNYASFSEGEKQRIDLSLLFTWRQIAKMKNSTSTNLLILDETFDSSLDHDGIDNLMKILGTLEDDSNVFVISHKGDLLDGKFRSKIEFTKERNFSKVA